MIFCVCRGKSETDIDKLIDAGASSLRDLQRCGVGDQCGACHLSLRAMITQSDSACPAHRSDLVAAPAPA